MTKRGNLFGDFLVSVAVTAASAPAYGLLSLLFYFFMKFGTCSEFSSVFDPDTPTADSQSCPHSVARFVIGRLIIFVLGGTVVGIVYRHDRHYRRIRRRGFYTNPL